MVHEKGLLYQFKWMPFRYSIINAVIIIFFILIIIDKRFKNHYWEVIPLLRNNFLMAIIIHANNTIE